MPSLQVRDMPDNLYHLLQQKAKSAHRSLAQEAIITLAKGLHTSGSHQRRREKLLDAIECSSLEINTNNTTSARSGDFNPGRKR